MITLPELFSTFGKSFPSGSAAAEEWFCGRKKMCNLKSGAVWAGQTLVPTLYIDFGPSKSEEKRLELSKYALGQLHVGSRVWTATMINTEADVFC